MCTKVAPKPHAFSIFGQFELHFTPKRLKKFVKWGGKCVELEDKYVIVCIFHGPVPFPSLLSQELLSIFAYFVTK